MDKKLKLKVFMRSFLIQAGWNFERFQNMGFYFSIYPVLIRIWKTPSELKQAFLRHISIFNTQPYMSGFVLGNVWKMEEKMSDADGIDRDRYEKEILNIKKALASSFASIGDRIFWGRLKPITVQIAILIWIASGYYRWLIPGTVPEWGLSHFVPECRGNHSMVSHWSGFLEGVTGLSPFWLISGPLCGTVLFSLFAIYIRWKGLGCGYECGGSSNCGLDAFNWSGIIRVLSIIGFVVSWVILLFSLAYIVLLNYSVGFPWKIFEKLGLIFGVILLHYFMKKLGYSSLQTILAMLLVTVLFMGMF
ncbi:MAG: PTS system mannose/fructose/sorbose family transporter subunit IID [Elusimicrobiota bacterium]